MDGFIERSAQLIQLSIAEAGNAVLPVIEESKRRPGNPCIYLGSTDKAKNAGIDADKLETYEYILKSIGKDIFIVGKDLAGPAVLKWPNSYWSYELGTVKAVTSFLEKYAGTRFVDVFDTLYDNRDITHQSFPDEAVMKGLANQVAYGVFNRDFKHPLFTNYMNGTNGWYRVGYQGRKNYGMAPYGLSKTIPVGGYGFWNRFNPDIGKILTAFWQWAQEAKATNDPDFLKYYSNGFFYKNGSSLQLLLEFLPTIADYKNN